MLEKMGYSNERSVIAYFSDLSASAEQVDELPIPYFERQIMGDPQVIADWDGNIGLLMTCSKVIDLDYDGDLDIVIGSMI